MLYIPVCVCVCQSTSIYMFINPKICLKFHKNMQARETLILQDTLELYTVFLKYTYSVLGRALCREVSYEIGYVRGLEL